MSSLVQVLDLTGKIDCPQCKTAGVLDVPSPSGNPAFETMRTCDVCYGDGFIDEPQRDERDEPEETECLDEPFWRNP